VLYGIFGHNCSKTGLVEVYNKRRLLVKKLAVGNRFWVGPEKDGSRPPQAKIDENLNKKSRWIIGAKSITSPDLVFAAIKAEEDKSDALNYLGTTFSDINVFPVTPWGKFVTPLNAIVLAAASKGAEQLLFVSTEFEPSKEIVDILVSHLDDQTLCVGARLDGHKFMAEHKGSQRFVWHASGTQIPWNTYALWDLRKLAKTGFLLVGDSPYEEKNAGVEELATLAAHARLWPTISKVKLLSVPTMSGQWDQTGWNEERKKKHEEKISSKDERPKFQLDRLGIPGPGVMHMVI
jgi:hypothetical protein